jgi:hypothetical protein
MVHLVLDDNQAELITRSGAAVEIRNRQGQRLGYFFPGFADEDVAVARQRLASDQPRYSFDEVQRRLDALEHE